MVWNCISFNVIYNRYILLLANAKCNVIDFIINPDTYARGQKVCIFMVLQVG